MNLYRTSVRKPRQSLGASGEGSGGGWYGSFGKFAKVLCLAKNIRKAKGCFDTALALLLISSWMVSPLRALSAASADEETPVHYQVSGRLTTFQPESPPLPKYQRHYTFRVEVNGCLWFVDLRPDPGTAPRVLTLGTNTVRESVPDYVQASSDGVWCYQVISLESARRANPKLRNAARAVRNPGRFPIQASEEICTLWYTYASHCLLANASNGMLPSIDPIPPSPENHKIPRMPAEWSVLETPPGLPQEVRWTYPDNDNNRAQQNNGACNLHAVFSTGDVTNIGGLTLPRTANVKYMLRATTAHAQDAQIRETITVDAATIASDAFQRTFIPTLPAPALVDEFRVDTQGQLRKGVVLANYWPTEAMAQAGVSALATRSTPVPGRGIFLLPLLILLIVLPLLVAYRYFRPARSPQERSTTS